MPTISLLKLRHDIPLAAFDESSMNPLIETITSPDPAIRDRPVRSMIAGKYVMNATRSPRTGVMRLRSHVAVAKVTATTSSSRASRATPGDVHTEGSVGSLMTMRIGSVPILPAGPLPLMRAPPCGCWDVRAGRRPGAGWTRRPRRSPPGCAA